MLILCYHSNFSIAQCGVSIVVKQPEERGRLVKSHLYVRSRQSTGNEKSRQVLSSRGRTAQKRKGFVWARLIYIYCIRNIYIFTCIHIYGKNQAGLEKDNKFGMFTHDELGFRKRFQTFLLGETQYVRCQLILLPGSQF